MRHTPIAPSICLKGKQSPGKAWWSSVLSQVCIPYHISLTSPWTTYIQLVVGFLNANRGATSSVFKPEIRIKTGEIRKPLGACSGAIMMIRLHPNPPHEQRIRYVLSEKLSRACQRRSNTSDRSYTTPPRVSTNQGVVVVT